MKRFVVTALAALIFSSTAWAVSNTDAIPVTEEKSPAYPVANSSIASKDAKGNTYLSLRSQVEERPTALNKPVYTKFSMAWSYGRGVGTIPNSCPQGYTSSPFGCKQGKQFSFKVCGADMEKQAGLCYKKCATHFKGVGPMCHGDLGQLDVSEVSDQVKDQYSKALAAANQPGVDLRDNKKPRLKTDIKFNSVVCANKTIINLFGNKLLPELVGKTWDQISKAVGTQTITDAAGKALWVTPGLSDFVLLDFAVGAKCESVDEISETASINVDTGITVKVSTKMFDPVLHNLGGVGVGAANVSIYELIPFRIYGSVASKLGTTVDYSATIYKNVSPVVFSGKHYAHQSKLEVVPNFKLWLGSQAYVRLPSFTDVLPDLMQVGAKFHLAIVDWKTPYLLQEGVKNPGVNNQWVLKESLNSELKAGYGHIKPFLNVLGINIKVFKDKHTLKWTGHESEKPLLIREGIYSI